MFMANKNLSRPNIVLILTDDQGFWAMGCSGNSEIHTPHLDRLAKSGIRFDNFFCTSPVCSPARASLLTGRIPSQHGVHDWIKAGNSPIEKDRGGVLIEYLKGQKGYTDILTQNGYTCGISGKWHLGDALHPQKGFSFWEVHAKGGGPYYNAPLVRNGRVYYEDRYVTDVITDNALKFLGMQSTVNNPFYLSVHYTAPHSPWDRDQHPENIYDTYYKDCKFESIPVEPMHPWQVSGTPYGDKHNRTAILAGYFAAVTAMDINVGRILEKLEAAGLRENTLVLFTSDNGMNMGHHGIYGKGNGTFPQNMFDTSVKVPMIISRPGHVPEGELRGELLSHYDVMPTLLDYLGMKNTDADTLPGKSFADLLEGKKSEVREDVVVFDEYGPVRMIRTKEWKYIHRCYYGPHELYNMANDPSEKNNLIECPEYADKAKEMKSQLEEWFLHYVDPMVDGSREPVTGRGQLGLAGPAGKGEKNFADGWKHRIDQI
jgi:arylsulfatase A-like enzyme